MTFFQRHHHVTVGPGGLPLVTSFEVEKQSPCAFPCWGRKRYVDRENYDHGVKNIEPLLDEVDDILAVSDKIEVSTIPNYKSMM